MLDAQGIAQPGYAVSEAGFMYIWFPMILHLISPAVYVLFFDMYSRPESRFSGVDK